MRSPRQRRAIELPSPCIDDQNQWRRRESNLPNDQLRRGLARATGRRRVGWYNCDQMSAFHDTSEDAARVRLGVYRRMAPSERLNVGLELTRMSRDLLAQGIRARHPEYSDDEVKWAVIRVWIGRDMFRRAYPHGPQLDP